MDLETKKKIVSKRNLEQVRFKLNKNIKLMVEAVLLNEEGNLKNQSEVLRALVHLGLEKYWQLMGFEIEIKAEDYDK